MSKVAKESFRVLKLGRQCAILIGDIRRKKHVIPLSFKLINIFLDAGFKLRELVIKRQHNCKSTGFWYENSIKYNFLLLAHEYLPIFEKPETSISSIIKEKEINYKPVVTISKKTLIEKKLNKLETTTVWIFSEKEFEKLLNKNVIDRYSNGEDYITITFNSHINRTIQFANRKKSEKIKLLFIKSPFLDNAPSSFEIEFYLKEIKNIVAQQLPNLSKDGFLVIQTKDVRIDGYIEPLAKKILDLLENENLYLKEIVILTQEEKNSNHLNLTEYLKIVHQYLLIYEIKK